MNRVIAILVVLLPALVCAQDASPVAAIEASLLDFVTVGRRPSRHCARAVGGCEARLHFFAEAFVTSGETHGIDPWLLAAMATRESSLNPFAMGGVAEGGIMQVHPCRSDLPAEVRMFVGPCPTSREDLEARTRRATMFRARCERVVGACQGPIVDFAARTLAASLARCGTIEAALGAYNSGECGETDYSRRVLARRDELMP